ncbi:hypothetical protein J7E28_17705 [Microbacterium sp. ISL-108]|nr:hypothetical protein [Microbacterium sp. ISL-108]
MPLHVDGCSPEPLPEGLRVGDGGDVHLFEVRGSAHSVHRGPEMISADEPEMLKFSMMFSGTGVVIQDGRHAALSPGALVLYEGAASSCRWGPWKEAV